MTTASGDQVLVIGTGIAGTMAALELSNRGMPVTLAGIPSLAGNYDVTVTDNVVNMFTNVSAWEIPSYTIAFDSHRAAHWQRPKLWVCKKRAIELALLTNALQAGVRHLSGFVTRLENTGSNAWDATVTFDGGHTEILEAQNVILATGADPGLQNALPEPEGRACAQLFAPAEDCASLVYLTPPDATDPHGAPTSIRALASPGADTMTISVTALVGGDADALMKTALSQLTALDPRYGKLQPIGLLETQVVSASFNPEASVRNGVLRVGAAAGLTNPFTGDGITSAIRSAVLAAEALEGGSGAAQRYRRILARNFVGQLGTTGHAARRYHLAWRMLADTASRDNPFFAKGRNAALLPGGFATLNSFDKMSLSRQQHAHVDLFMLSCTEIVVATVRDHWPFLASLITADQGQSSRAARPSLLFAAATMAGGRRPDVRWAPVAAAIELTMLGMLAFTATNSTIEAIDRGVDWPSATAVLAGDFMLSRASQLVTTYAPSVSSAFSGWMFDLVELRACELAQPGHCAEDFFRSLLEFPARIGADLGGADDDTVALLREIGRIYGETFIHTEDLLALRGKKTRLDITLAGLLGTHLSAIPSIIGATTAQKIFNDGVLHAKALKMSRRRAVDSHERATGIIEKVIPDRSRILLEDLITSLAEPALSETSYLEHLQEERR